MCQENINSCGEVLFAPCVNYEEALPEFTKITKNCVNLEDTTKDIYLLIGELKEQVPEDLQDKLEAIEGRLTELEAQVTALQNENICLKDITDCVNTQSLTDPCGEPVENLGQLLNYILNQLNP